LATNAGAVLLSSGVDRHETMRDGPWQLIEQTTKKCLVSNGANEAVTRVKEGGKKCSFTTSVHYFSPCSLSVPILSSCTSKGTGPYDGGPSVWQAPLCVPPETCRVAVQVGTTRGLSLLRFVHKGSQLYGSALRPLRIRQDNLKT